MERSEREKLKTEYAHLFMTVRGVINELDPAGLIGIGAPDHEHDSLTGHVLRLILNHDFEKVRPLLIDCYEWYGFEIQAFDEKDKEIFYNKIDRITNKLHNIYIELRDSNK
ncbi:hypothetical protein D3P08_09595 [Paenibacillus nanensis]|uniref:Uncharacterized protein n=1 Tax=Paenibacillus nanensis TaxID=393251 RepID=A0A3A1UYV2_9BACL|nr:hypothetical protein [Paenibacillus nanensis]RIX53668.1 hypothetical protein D3P08_09595 [Paenibacillus nanensis]